MQTSDPDIRFAETQVNLACFEVDAETGEIGAELDAPITSGSPTCVLLPENALNVGV